MFLSTRKQFKRSGVNTSCVCQQGSSLQVLVFMHHPFVTKEAVQKLWCLYILCVSSRKQFKSCGVYASCVYLQGSKVNR